jgi:hypothetical protein
VSNLGYQGLHHGLRLTVWERHERHVYPGDRGRVGLDKAPIAEDRSERRDAV